MIYKVSYRVENSKYGFICDAKSSVPAPFVGSKIPVQLPNNSHYFVAFLGKKDWTPNERAFFEFKKALARREHAAEVQDNIATWDFDTNSTKENMDRASKASDRLTEIQSDPEILKKLREFKKNGIKDAALKEDLKTLIDFYKSQIGSAKEDKLLGKKQNEISQKTNTYTAKIDGKETSTEELRNRLKTETNPSVRKTLYIETEVKPGDLIAQDLIELVKMRNKFAKAKGFDNYFSYMLSETHDVNEKELFTLLDTLDEKTRPAAIRIYKENEKALISTFGVKIKDLQPWHYQQFCPANNPNIEVNNYLKSPEKIAQGTKSMFRKMGWDIDELPIQFDLLPRKNKNQYAATCYSIDACRDARVFANLTKDIDSFENMSHELGHAVYNLGLSPRLRLDNRGSASTALDEAIAMIMGSLHYREDVLSREFKIPAELIKKVSEKQNNYLIKFIRYYLLLINFEKKLYQNPDQNLPALWAKLKTKFEFANPPKKLDNSWAAVEHYLIYPAYLQNYVRAEIMASQIYETAVEKLGPLTHNKGTAELFRKNFFRYGKSLTDVELIERFTGKPLSTDAFIRRIQHLL